MREIFNTFWVTWVEYFNAIEYLLTPWVLKELWDVQKVYF